MHCSTTPISTLEWNMSDLLLASQNSTFQAARIKIQHFTLHELQFKTIHVLLSFKNSKVHTNKKFKTKLVNSGLDSARFKN